MARKRKNGDGTVRLRKDGRWEGRYVVGYDDSGNPKTKNVLAKTKGECVEKLKKLKESLGGIKSDKIKPDMPFGDWIDFWYQNHCKPKVRQTTQMCYETRIYLHIIPELGKIKLNKLTQNDLQQFYTRLKTEGRQINADIYGEGLSDRTIRGCHANCRAALEKAVQDGLIRTNPAIGCKLPPKKAREMQVLTHEEMQRFLIQAKEEGYFELFLLELATGLRRGEIMALQWADLDFETGELSITKQIYRARGELIISEPKTKASIRKLILPQGLLDVLREYRQAVHSRWMFPSPVKDDFPMDPAWIRKKLHIILEHAECKGLRFHDLRHTFCTTALEHGMDVKTLSALLGHVSSATTLNIYTHITDNMRQDAAAKIDRGLGNTVADDADKRSDKTAEKPKQAFQPYKGDKRRAGTGCITQISEHCWEGRYSPMWPDGKKHSRNIYGKTREECESKLPDLIAEMKAEIAAIKAGGAEAMSAIPDGISKKKKSIVEYMHANPMVTNKALIARESGASRWTVQKYYDEIRRDVSRGATA